MRRWSAALSVLVAAAGAAAAALWWPGPEFAVVVVAYVAAAAVTIPTAGGQRVSLVPAVAGATAMLTGASPVMVVAAGAVALPAGLLVTHLRHGMRTTGYVYPAEPVGVVVFAALVSAAVPLMPSSAPDYPPLLGVFVASAIMAFFVSVGIRALFSGELQIASRRLVAMRSLADWPAHAALYASGALFAVTVGPMGGWAVPVAGFPFFFSHFSLQRLQSARRTYDQTIRALGAIPEAGDRVPAGHASRTADLAVAVGAEIGLDAPALRQLEYAALLHDIGRLVLANPAIASGDYSGGDVADWSAAIIGEVRDLERAAQIVARQHWPYRREGQERDASVPRESQVVRVAVEYDHATSRGVAPTQSLEMLHQGAAYDYDPEVVAALRRVLDQRGALAA